MSMTYHLSGRSNEWKECRARVQACPFGSESGEGAALHADVAGIVRVTAAAHALGETHPSSLSVAGGPARAITVEEDGTVRIGGRRYDPDGNKIISESAARTARRRARLETDAYSFEPAPDALEAFVGWNADPQLEDAVPPSVPEAEQDPDEVSHEIGLPPWALPQDQAEGHLRRMAEKRWNFGEEELETWMGRDNGKAIEAVQAALALLPRSGTPTVEDETEAGRLLVEAGVAWTDSDYYHHSGSTHYTVRLRDARDYGSARITPRNLKRVLLDLRREDRSTLLTAVGLPADAEPNPFYAAIALSVVEEHRETKKRRDEAEKTDALTKPIDWTKTSKKDIRARLGTSYNPDDPAHQDFEAALMEAKQLPKEKFWLPYSHRSRYTEKWLNHLVDTVSQHRRSQAYVPVKPAASLNLKASVARIIEDLGPQYDPSEPAHQELRSAVASVTARRTQAYPVKPEYRQERGHFETWRNRFSETEPAELSPADQDAVHSREVDGRLRGLFTAFRGDRSRAVSELKKQLKDLAKQGTDPASI